MKVKCVNNRNVEKFLTQGKEYEVENSKLDQNRFIMIDDTLYTHSHNKSRFEVVPSIDDVIKDKEKEKRTMNGLEAIELMKQGKMVDSDKHYPHFIDLATGKLLVWVCGNGSLSTSFDVNYEGYREYIEPKPLTGWERVGDGEDVYFISAYEGVRKDVEGCDDIDIDCYNVANYFSTEEKAEEINFKQTLFRKLQRFSDENGGNEIDWSDTDQLKYGIFYNSDSNRLLSDDCWVSREFGQVYFISEKVAEKAIELFKDDLIKYFTGDFGGKGNE